MNYDIVRVRSQFPSLLRAGRFFDNPGGTQISQPALDRMMWYFRDANAQRGGKYETGQKVDESFAMARSTYADFINAKGPQEIIFGNNMTTLTMAISQSIGHWLKSGDEIVLTHLEHDGNIAPWLLLAEEKGLKVRWVDFNNEDCTLDLNSLQKALESKPRLLAVGYASNAIGTINPLEKIIPMAHAAGAMVYVDAVQYAPHGPIDVQKLNCEFLVCSPYKFYGPHIGVLYGRYDMLEKLYPYKVRPSSNEIPMRFETGTLNQEGIAGLWGTMEYFEWLGSTFGEKYESNLKKTYSGKPLVYKKAMAAMHEYERGINLKMLEVFKFVLGIHIYGITDEKRIDERVTTYGITMEGWTPADLAEALGKAGIYVMYGNFYALDTCVNLGVEQHGGLVRFGASHYTTIEEIEYTGKVLQSLAKK